MKKKQISVMPTLTTVEESTMMVIWKIGTAFMRDIMEALPEPKPHQNTVSTYLRILIEKGYLSPEKVGRIYKYRVVVPFVNYRKKMLEQFLADFFDNSPEQLIQVLQSEYEGKVSSASVFREGEDTEMKRFVNQLTEIETESQKDKIKSKKNKKKKKKNKKRDKY